MSRSAKPLLKKAAEPRTARPQCRGDRAPAPCRDELMKDNHVRVIGCGWFAKARALSISSEIQMVFRCGPRRTLFGHAASLK